LISMFTEMEMATDVGFQYPLVLTKDSKDDIANLTAMASARVVDMKAVHIEDQSVYASYKALLRRMTLKISNGYKITYTHEDHNGMLVRHLSVSVNAERLLPNTEAVNMLASEFGFEGDNDDWMIWIEPISNDYAAVNIVQPLSDGCAAISLH
jgi:hypothetical protein